MKYDDASWHYGGEFDPNLPPEAGATHIGMFVAWALLNGLGNPEEEFDTSALQSRSQTPGQFIMEECDEKFIDSFLNEEGNQFTEQYYQSEKGTYNQDYEKVLVKELPSVYHVQDTWSNFDQLKSTIDQRYLEWKSGSQSASTTKPEQQGWLQKLTAKLFKKP